MFTIRGHVSDMEQREEALEQPASDVEEALVGGKSLSLLVPQEVLGRLAALIFIYLQENRVWFHLNLSWSSDHRGSG